MRLFCTSTKAKLYRRRITAPYLGWSSKEHPICFGPASETDPQHSRWPTVFQSSWFPREGKDLTNFKSLLISPHNVSLWKIFFGHTLLSRVECISYFWCAFNNLSIGIRVRLWLIVRLRVKVGLRVNVRCRLRFTRKVPMISLPSVRLSVRLRFMVRARVRDLHGLYQ